MFLDHAAVSARCLLGARDRENVMLFCNFTQTHLQQNQFDVARRQYHMDFPRYHAELDGYYYNAKDTLEMAAGVELVYDERNGLDSVNLQPLDYRVCQARIPLMFGGKILSFLHIWSEVDVMYALNTAQASHTLAVQQAYGVKIVIAPLEINIYTTPFVKWFKSENASDTQAAALGVDLMAVF